MNPGLPAAGDFDGRDAAERQQIMDARIALPLRAESRQQARCHDRSGTWKRAEDLMIRISCKHRLGDLLQLRNAIAQNRHHPQQHLHHQNRRLDDRGILHQRPGLRHLRQALLDPLRRTRTVLVEEFPQDLRGFLLQLPQGGPALQKGRHDRCAHLIEPT